MIIEPTTDDLSKVKLEIETSNQPAILCCNEPSKHGTIYRSMHECSNKYDFVTWYWCPNVPTFVLLAFNGLNWIDVDKSSLQSNIEHTSRTIEWLLLQSLVVNRIESRSSLCKIPHKSHILVFDGEHDIPSTIKTLHKWRTLQTHRLLFTIEKTDDEISKPFTHNGVYMYEHPFLRLIRTMPTF